MYTLALFVLYKMRQTLDFHEIIDKEMFDKHSKENFPVV